MPKPDLFQIREGRPVVWQIARDFWATNAAPAFGVSVRLGREAQEITAFCSADDAWAAGVDALADMIARAA